MGGAGRGEMGGEGGGGDGGERGGKKITYALLKWIGGRKGEEGEGRGEMKLI